MVRDGGIDRVGWYKYNNKTGATTDDSQTAAADGSGTHEVKQKTANALGLYDISGNVHEWCWDLFGTSDRRKRHRPDRAGRHCRYGSLYSRRKLVEQCLQ